MKALIFLVAFITIVLIVKPFNAPKQNALEKQPDIEKVIAEQPPKHPPLGLVSKKRITKNVVKEATVWETVYSVKRGLITFRTIDHEVFPGEFKHTIKVKHQNLKGDVVYSRIASTHSNSITIYRRGKGTNRTEITELINFRDEPSEDCLKNRFRLLDMPEACNATVIIISGANTQLLKFTTHSALLKEKHGKAKWITENDPDFIGVVKRHIKKIYKQIKVVKPFREPAL